MNMVYQYIVIVSTGLDIQFVNDQQSNPKGLRQQKCHNQVREK